MTARRTLLFVLSMVLWGNNVLVAMHNTSRFFPFLEKPEPYGITHFSTFHPAFFFTDATSASKQGEGNFGIPEIWGTYDLNDVVNSARQVTEKINGQTFTNPFNRMFRPDFLDKSICYRARGKLKSWGIECAYEQNLYWRNLFLGIWIPFMQVTSHQAFEFDPDNSDPAVRALKQSEIDEIDAIRRDLHESIGLESGDSVRSGFGDLDVHLRLHKEWYHTLLMRSININFQGGIIVPTGRRMDINKPASVPFMGDGHFGYYFDVMPEFELKTDLRLGFMFGMQFQRKKNKKLRISVGNEPHIFSALTGSLKVSPGHSWKLAAYLIFENILDGLHLQFRYTYLKHNEDTIKDRRSFAERNLLPVVLERSEIFSLWKANYFTFQLHYDPKEAGNNWPLSPNVYVMYDYPFETFGSTRSVKSHKFTLGVVFHF